ncbi:DUF4199 domain-containing protein [Salinimicrobium gaetbulicola]|uniref:DUF4199 domain-containing protein n=1 Tax=Salinimicrobium gaetbulicola TaxID=999702 RepID=A0ABW3IB36_9FLAO
MEKSIKSTGTSFGIYLGVFLILITTLAYSFDLSLFTKWWFGIFSFVILLVISIIGVRKAKKIYSGPYFSFKNAFTTYFLIILVGTLLATLFSILLFSFVDTEAAQTVTELTIETSREMMEKFGAPEASINEALAELENDNQFSVLNQLKKFVFGLGFYLIIGLIIALIFKEKDPNKA